MKTVKLNLKKRSYDIIIGSGSLSALGKYLKKLTIGRDAHILTNPVVFRKYGRRLNHILTQSGFEIKTTLIPDTEKSKSIETASRVIKDIARQDKGKRVLIIAFGGGVVGDLAGFIASIYKRGIPYIQIPTTLLAQVDSSIGGKTAVDLTEGKNLIGAFHQPKLVLSDVDLLKTLDKKQLRAGLAEAIKYGIIKDSGLFSYLEKNHSDIFRLKSKSLEYIVWRCSLIKAGIVSRDEKEERGIRTILNFGHTAGHAIEAASGYKGYNHGEAVALGMLVAAAMSRKLKLINDKTAERIEGLIRSTGLPLKIKNIPLNRIIRAHYRDKKFIGKRNRFVLIKGIGRAKVVENVPLEVIESALKERF